MQVGKIKHSCFTIAVVYLCTPIKLTSSLSMRSKQMNRKSVFKRLFSATGTLSLLCIGSILPRPVCAFTPDPTTSFSVKKSTEKAPSSTPVSVVGYKSLALPLKEYNVRIPIAGWFPIDESQSTGTVSQAAFGRQSSKPIYNHQISVRRIGQLLAGWDFIPGFVSKSYDMSPSATKYKCIDCSDDRNDVRSLLTKPDQKIVILAHGYLGSRFDLSHLAETLAGHGYTCIAAEYPESLAASYERQPGLDRSVINTALIRALGVGDDTQCRFGVVGHSLGCGTVQQIGDDSWARVSIAGFPRNRDGTPLRNGLFVTSMGDGAVSLAKFGGPRFVAECGYELLSAPDINNDFSTWRGTLPQRAALVLENPNHISFLAENVNDAMIDFLSPLLPIAQAMEIPVLDFDKYQYSRDSKPTAEIVHPLILRYLEQEMGK
jgi:hypothetical protein